MFSTIPGAVITAVLMALVILAVKLWPTVKALLPNWATNILVTMADVFVRWAESEYGAAKGPEKFHIVLEKLESYLADIGIQIDADIIIAAIEAAWTKMNAEQIAAGIKEG